MTETPDQSTSSGMQPATGNSSELSQRLHEVFGPRGLPHFIYTERSGSLYYRRPDKSRVYLGRGGIEQLSNLVFRQLNQAAA